MKKLGQVSTKFNNEISKFSRTECRAIRGIFMSQTDEQQVNVDHQVPEQRTRWLRWLRWWPALTLLLPLAYCQAVDALNEHGVCMREMRRLSDSELIHPWVEAAVKNYPPLDEKGRKNDTGEWASALQDYGSPIPYRDSAEFFAINPDCCTVQSFSPTSGYSPDEDQRKGGFGRGYVKLEYKLRYQAKDGSNRFRIYVRGVAVTNCGDVSGHPL